LKEEELWNIDVILLYIREIYNLAIEDKLTADQQMIISMTLIITFTVCRLAEL
jgi:hypothetical protein